MRGWLVLAVAALLPAAPARAQWVLEASAGGAVHESVAADVGTRSAILGLRYEGAPWLYLAAGAPLDSAGLPWGAAGIGGRWTGRLGLVSFGADLAGFAHLYREPSLGAVGGGGTLEALPFVALSRGASAAELYSGLLHYTSAFDGATTSRSLHDSGLRLEHSLSPAVALSVVGRYVRAEEDAYPYLGAAVETVRGRGGVWGYAGRWLSDAVESPVWGVGASYGIGERLGVSASFEQETNDPLYWNAPRRRWSLGVTHRFGGAAAVVPLPVLPEVVDGRVTLRIPLSEAELPPSVAGDFTGWQPVPMTRSGDSWAVSLEIPSGVHHYSFRRADGTWFVPDSVRDRVDDGFGGVNAVLIVP